jgi:hypothetical protein
VTQEVDEPLGVVELGEGGHGLVQVVDVVVELGPESLLFEAADEAVCSAVALGLAHIGDVVFDPEPGRGADEVMRSHFRSC